MAGKGRHRLEQPKHHGFAKGVAVVGAGSLLALTAGTGAFADTIVLGADVTKAPGDSGSFQVYLAADDNSSDLVNGCNASGQNPVTIAFSSTNTAVAAAPASAAITVCDDPLTSVVEGAQTVSYSVLSTATNGTSTSIGATGSGGKDSFYFEGSGADKVKVVVPEGTFTGDSLVITVSAANPCDSVSAPATPTFTNGGSSWYNIASGIPTPNATSSPSGATVGYSTVSGGPYNSTPPSLSQGTSTVYAAATSATCNKVSGEASQTFKVDTVAPVATTSLSRVADHNGWYNAPVGWSTTATDAGGSGVDGTTCSAGTYSSPDGRNRTVSGTCADIAGNVSASAASDAFDFDNTDPLLSPTVSPNPVVLGASAAASAGATDNLSGVDAANTGCDAVDTSSVGAGQSVACHATDNAGNTNNASASYAVVYNWHGFFQPVDNLPTENVAKAGSSVPVKFDLGAEQRLEAVTYVKWVTYTCSPTAPSDAIEGTVDATTNPGLKYDTVAKQYVYVWKTDKTYVSTCRQITVKLADGTLHSANFKFTK